MKKIIPIVLAILTVFCTGCKARDTGLHTPVVFYYCVDKLDYTSNSSIIQRAALSMRRSDGSL